MFRLGHRGGGRCSDLVTGGGLTIGVAHLPPPGVEVTHACENITFARFATRAVMMRSLQDLSQEVPPTLRWSAWMRYW